MSDLIVFATIGALAGAAARLWYPGRELTHIVGTMLVGMVGGVLGGVASWTQWSGNDGQLYPGALLMSLLGAILVLVVWAFVSYGRRISKPG